MLVIKYSNLAKRLKLKEEINDKKMFGGWNHYLVCQKNYK
jgi:hypothetical protein